MGCGEGMGWDGLGWDGIGLGGNLLPLKCVSFIQVMIHELLSYYGGSHMTTLSILVRMEKRSMTLLHENKSRICK
jgi:hypothetical protein